MTLKELGFSDELERYWKEQNQDSFEVGRVVSENRERYTIKTADKEYEGEIIGNLRFTANNRSDFPAVGDWVAISEYDDDKVLIHFVLPRNNVLERQAVGKKGEKQIIASNVDYAFIVQSVDRDFNINRMERYLTVCNASGVKPIVVLTKIDLISDAELTTIISASRERIGEVPVYSVSNESSIGLNELKKSMIKSKTYCLMGSSGVGKSTLLNNLSGQDRMKTGSISTSTQKGMHVTSHRELIILDNGAIIIDNPGMRELGITDSTGGLEKTFLNISDLSRRCKFKDCSHQSEEGCAVIEAVNRGDLDERAYENYQKMEREREHYESTVAERRKKDKAFGKMLKNYKKDQDRH
jgi:ribosome biogenesis GTPase